MAGKRARRSKPPRPIAAASFAELIQSIRGDVSLEKFARRLGISRANLCDVERGRKGVSAERASRWARVLGYTEALFVQHAIQAELDAAGLKLLVRIEAA